MTGARRLPAGLAVLLALLALWAFATMTLCLGQQTFSAWDAYAVIARRGLRLPVEEPTTDRLLGPFVWGQRFPRVVLASLAGAGLALAGVAAQALVRNPLADPFVLGVSSGASLGAVVAMAWGIGLGGVVGQASAAVLGALLALLVVMAVASHGGQTSSLRLVLAGIAVAYALTGLIGYLIVARLGGGAEAVTYVLGGDLGNARLHGQWLPAAVLLAGACLLFLDARGLNALLLGDETAASLGVDPARLRLRLVLVVAGLTGVMVSQVGVIGFVGLVVPHIARHLVGTDHRRVLPVAAALGAAYLVGCDYLAHTAASPSLLPVGVVAGALGAPLFLWLLLLGQRARRI
ncbi:MAG: FecCD family ABC transporter permease [Sporichthyaceae bacterium]